MIMNYVLSFCKITAASRIFSRNFYLPLLKPITPKDALRTFKITGKWLLGSKIQHYIPVLFNHKKKRSKRVKDYGQTVHRFNDSYTYMTPIIDVENESHKLLMNILESKNGIGESFMYVYTVEDKMLNLVFPAKMELAIQDGDVIDVLVSQSSDKILIKLKDFKKIAIELEFYDNKENLRKGEGATTAEEEQFHHHGKMIMALAKIFEAKELAEEWELEMMKIVAKKKRQKGEGTKEWNDMINECIENLDWDKFEVDAKKVIDQIWEPVQEDFIGMKVDDLNKTRNIIDFVNKYENGILLDLLPTMSEIADVVKNMGTAIYEELELYIDHDDDDDATISKLSGVRVILSSGKEVFITGQMVQTEDGDIFVPGQTIENEFGQTYAPGFTVNMNNVPTLIKGLIMGEEDQQKPMFLPTESSITADGELTFCRNPEERTIAKPQKIFVKRKEKGDCDEHKNKKKKKQKCEKHEEAVPIIADNIPDTNKVEIQSEVEDEEIKLVLIPVEEILNKIEAANNSSSEDDNSITEKNEPDDTYRPIDDGMDRLIDNLQDKKSELEKKLEALRRLCAQPLENSVTYVNLSDANELASKIAAADTEEMHKLSEILLTIVRRASTFRQRHDVSERNINNPSVWCENSTFVTEGDEKFCRSSGQQLKIALKSAMYAANEIFKTRPRDQLLALHTVADILGGALDNDEIVEELCLLMNTNLDRNEICTSILKQLTENLEENKLEVLKRCVSQSKNENDLENLFDKLCNLLSGADSQDGGEVFGLAFKKLAKTNLSIVTAVLHNCQLAIDDLKTEHGAVECLQNGISVAVKSFLDEAFLNFCDESDNDELKEFVQEAIGLAKTLDLYQLEESLDDLLKEGDIGYLLQTDRTRVDFVKRFLLIKKLCERDYSMKTSLERIRKHPECGRKDPRIRQLLRESAALQSKGRQIRSSLEVPLRLFRGQNFIAIEDCVNQLSRVQEPLLISRNGIQAVVPKEAARNVLAGRVPYILIDETGVTRFKPMHMLNAMKLTKNLESRYKDFPSLGGRESTSQEKRRSVERIYKRTSPDFKNNVRLLHIDRMQA